MAAHSPELRLGDAERQQALDALGEHFAQGRLTREELDERSDAVWSAKTHGDLSPLFADLPVGRAPRPERSRMQGRPGPRPFPGPFLRPLLVPLFVVLVVLTVLTHLPLVLLAVALWFVLGHRRWHHQRG
jgi:uncharacterized membrane protein